MKSELKDLFAAADIVISRAGANSICELLALKTVSYTHLIKPEKANLQNLPPEICANWYHCFDEGKCIVIQDLEEMRESDPLQYENLKRQGIHSIVVVPIYDKGKVIAFYGVDNPPPMLLEYTFSMLQIMG